MIERPLIIEKVRLFDGRRAVMSEPVTVLVERGRISAIGPDLRCEQGYARIPEQELFGVYGLFESHAHLGFATVGPKADPAGTLRDFLSHGVLQVRDVGGPLTALESLRSNIRSGSMEGPDIFYAGPMLEHSPLHWAQHNQLLPGFTVELDSVADAERIVTELADHGADLVKTFFKQDHTVFKHLLKAARQARLPVTLDPGPPFFQSVPINLGLEWGVRCFEHATNLLLPSLRDDLLREHDQLKENQSPTDRMEFAQKVLTSGWEAVDSRKFDALCRALIDHDAYFCPTLDVFERMVLQQDKAPDDEQRSPEQVINVALRTLTRQVAQRLGEAGVRLLIGHDGCDSEGAVREIERLAQCGIPAADLLQAATINPARWLGVDAEYGLLEPGYKANFILLERNPLDDLRSLRKPRYVIHAGQIWIGNGL